MGPNVVNCYSCGQKVDASHFVQALAANNVFVGVQLAYKVLSGKMTDEDARSFSHTINSNSHKLAVLPSNYCKLCRQKKY